MRLEGAIEVLSLSRFGGLDLGISHKWFIKVGSGGIDVHPPIDLTVSEQVVIVLLLA